MESTLEQKLTRMRAHYPGIFPIRAKGSSRHSLSPEEIQSLISIFEGKTDRNLVIFSKKDIFRTIAFILLSQKDIVSFDVMNAYRLIEIYLGFVEGYQTLSDIVVDYLLIYLGYNEFENRQQGNSISQVIEQRVNGGQYTWLFYKETKTHFKNKYPNLHEHILDREFEEVDLCSSFDISTVFSPTPTSPSPNTTVGSPLDCPLDDM